MIHLIKEFWSFLKVRKKYWLLPIFLVFGILAALIFATSGSTAAPFIYTLF